MLMIYRKTHSHFSFFGLNKKHFCVFKSYNVLSQFVYLLFESQVKLLKEVKENFKLIKQKIRPTSCAICILKRNISSKEWELNGFNLHIFSIKKELYRMTWIILTLIKVYECTHNAPSPASFSLKIVKKILIVTFCLAMKDEQQPLKYLFIFFKIMFSIKLILERNLF